jgi:ATP-binding cassette subfamily B (MDR/TAP) protein 1
MGKPAPLDADVEQHAYKQQQPSARPYRAPSPSILLIFSYCTKADVVLGLCPAILISLAAGGVAPLMTLVVGQAFDAMAVFTTSADLAAREQLMHSIKLVSLELVALAVGTLVLDFAMAFIWLWLGERIIMRIRHKVFAAVSSRDIEWFDLLNEQSTEGPEDSVGAGGLLAKFAR